MRKQFTYQQQMHYELLGSGPVVVLLHGFGEDSSVWRNQKQAFPGFQLLIPDLPGSGGSEMLEDMSMESLSNSLLALLDEEKIDQCILIGHSMGGYVTLAFAEKYSDRLKGFGLLHSTSFADTDAKKETRQKGIAFIKEHGAAAFLRTSTPNLFSEETKENNKKLIEDQIQFTAPFKDAALIAYYESMMKRPDRTPILEQSTLPVLFILGKHDSAIPIQDGLQQCHLPTISYTSILEESGHMGMLEETAKCNHYLNDFFTDIYKSS